MRLDTSYPNTAIAIGREKKIARKKSLLVYVTQRFDYRPWRKNPGPIAESHLRVVLRVVGVSQSGIRIVAILKTWKFGQLQQKQTRPCVSLTSLSISMSRSSSLILNVPERTIIHNSDNDNNVSVMVCRVQTEYRDRGPRGLGIRRLNYVS